MKTRCLIFLCFVVSWIPLSAQDLISGYDKYINRDPDDAPPLGSSSPTIKSVETPSPSTVDLADSLAENGAKTTPAPATPLAEPAPAGMPSPLANSSPAATSSSSPLAKSSPAETPPITGDIIEDPAAAPLFSTPPDFQDSPLADSPSPSLAKELDAPSASSPPPYVPGSPSPLAEYDEPANLFIPKDEAPSSPTYANELSRNSPTSVSPSFLPGTQALTGDPLLYSDDEKQLAFDKNTTPEVDFNTDTPGKLDAQFPEPNSDIDVKIPSRPKGDAPQTNPTLLANEKRVNDIKADPDSLIDNSLPGFDDSWAPTTEDLTRKPSPPPPPKPPGALITITDETVPSPNPLITEAPPVEKTVEPEPLITINDKETKPTEPLEPLFTIGEEKQEPPQEIVEEKIVAAPPVSDETVVVSLLPAEQRPPESDPTFVERSTTEDTVIEEKIVRNDDFVILPEGSIDLTRGKSYLQVGAYSQEKLLEEAFYKLSNDLNTEGKYYPLTSVKNKDGKFRLFVGPLNPDESGVVYYRLKNLNYTPFTPVTATYKDNQ